MVVADVTRTEVVADVRLNVVDVAEVVGVVVIVGV